MKVKETNIAIIEIWSKPTTTFCVVSYNNLHNPIFMYLKLGLCIFSLHCSTKMAESPAKLTEFAPHDLEVRPAGGFFARLFGKLGKLWSYLLSTHICTGSMHCLPT